MADDKPTRIAIGIQDLESQLKTAVELAVIDGNVSQGILPPKDPGFYSKVILAYVDELTSRGVNKLLGKDAQAVMELVCQYPYTPAQAVEFVDLMDLSRPITDLKLYLSQILDADEPTVWSVSHVADSIVLFNEGDYRIIDWMLKNTKNGKYVGK